MRSEEEFKKQAEKKGITHWIIHDCGICGYSCGYHFKEDGVYYDNGCDCISIMRPMSLRSWDEVADYYNMQSNPDYIKKMDQFWGF